eukprot:UN05645
MILLLMPYLLLYLVNIWVLQVKVDRLSWCSNTCVDFHGQLYLEYVQMTNVGHRFTRDADGAALYFSKFAQSIGNYVEGCSLENVYGGAVNVQNLDVEFAVRFVNNGVFNFEFDGMLALGAGGNTFTDKP